MFNSGHISSAVFLGSVHLLVAPLGNKAGKFLGRTMTQLPLSPENICVMTGLILGAFSYLTSIERAKIRSEWTAFKTSRFEPECHRKNLESIVGRIFKGCMGLFFFLASMQAERSIRQSTKNVSPYMAFTLTSLACLNRLIKSNKKTTQIDFGIIAAAGALVGQKCF